MIVPGFKFILWDFDPERKDELDDRSKANMKAGLKLSKNDIPVGYYFRWSVELYSTKGLFLHCVAEDSYTELKITPPSAEKIWRFMNNSENQFLEKFAKRMAIIEFNYVPSFDLTREEAQFLYEEFLRG